MNTATSPSDVTAPAFPTDGPGAGTIPGLLLAQAARNPDGIAMREKKFGIWQETTWRTFRDEVEAVALALADLGVGADDRAGVISDNEPAWLFADLAIQSLGAWSVAAYPTQVASEVGYIMGHSGCRVLFCGDQEQTDKIIGERGAGNLPDLERIVVFDMKGVAEYEDPMIESFDDFTARGRKLAAEDRGALERFASERSPEDVAYTGFTSGTTGKPKGALLKHRNQVTMAGVMTAWIDFTSDDKILCHLPLCHPAVRVNDAYVSLYSGASLNFPESPESVSTDMFELAPTFLLGTPRVFEVMKAEIETRVQRAAWLKRRAYRWGMRTMLRHLDATLAGGRGQPIRRFLAYWLVGRWVVDKLGLRKLRYATVGGSSVSPELMKFLWSLGIAAYETYGQSETSGVAISQRSFADLGTAGWLLPTLEARISDTQELLLRGDGIFAGYLDLPETTAEAFIDGWSRTGDIARIDEAGRIVILDREKHVIHTASGQELSPSEIENKLKLSPYVSEAMVVGRDRGHVTALIQIEYGTVADWAQRQNLAYTTFKSLTERPEVRTLIEEAVASANEFLPDEKRVRDFRMFPRELNPDIDEITPTRKIKRNVVEERFGDLIEDMYRQTTDARGA